jgi:hypothetical protein
MQSFRSVNSAVHAAVAGLTLLIFQHLDQLQAYIADYKAYAIPAILSGLALLFRMSDSLAKAILEKVPFLSPGLRRLLSGKDDVEGDWSLVVVDMDKQALLYYGFLRIDFRNGQLYIAGDDWLPDGGHAQTFRSMQALYRNHTLQYWYEQGESLHRPEMRGYTEIFFFPNGELAERHAGKFLDPNHTSDIRFYARKRQYRRFERRLASADAKIKAARELWSEIEPRLNYLRGREISADFA